MPPAPQESADRIRKAGDHLFAALNETMSDLRPQIMKRFGLNHRACNLSMSLATRKTSALAAVATVAGGTSADAVDLMHQLAEVTVAKMDEINARA